MIVDSKNIKKRKRGYLKNTLNTHYYNYCKSFGIWLERLGYASTTVIIYTLGFLNTYKNSKSLRFTPLHNNTFKTTTKYYIWNPLPLPISKVSLNPSKLLAPILKKQNITNYHLKISL